jgi:hypothetical protein
MFTTVGRVISSVSAATIAPFDSFAALSRSGQAQFVYHGRKPTNLRVSLGARANLHPAGRTRCVLLAIGHRSSPYISLLNVRATSASVA